jgi:hypothetical protein
MTRCCTRQTSLSLSFSALLLFCSCAIVGCRLGCFRSAVTRLHTCTHYLMPAFRHRFIRFEIAHMIDVSHQVHVITSFPTRPLANNLSIQCVGMYRFCCRASCLSPSAVREHLPLSALSHLHSIDSHHTIGPHYFCTAMPPALASTSVIASRYFSQQLTLMLQASLFCSL